MAVYKHKDRKVWRVRIWIHGLGEEDIGSFATKELAQEAYRKARINFPLPPRKRGTVSISRNRNEGPRWEVRAPRPNRKFIGCFKTYYEAEKVRKRLFG